MEERLRLLERREKAVELLVMARYLQTWRNQHAGLYAPQMAHYCQQYERRGGAVAQWLERVTNDQVVAG